MKTEQELRDEPTPYPKTKEELIGYIDNLLSQEHDYGTGIYAMSLSAVAVFNYVGCELDVTIFQANCADLDFIRRTRNLKHPFMLLKAGDLLYPQYNLHQDVAKAIQEWRKDPWIKEEAQKLLNNRSITTHPAVIKHWENIIASFNTQTQQ